MEMGCVLTSHLPCIIDSFIGKILARSLEETFEMDNDYLDNAVGTIGLTPNRTGPWLRLGRGVGGT